MPFPLRRREEWDPFVSEFQKAVDRFFGRSDVTFSEQQMRQPNLEISETDQEYLVKVEIPGIRKEDVTIDLHDGLLTVKGEKKEKKEEKTETCCYTERRYGRFERSISLEKKVDPEGVEATYNSGVLEVKLPKVEPEITTKRIEIKDIGP